MYRGQRGSRLEEKSLCKRHGAVTSRRAAPGDKVFNLGSYAFVAKSRTQCFTKFKFGPVFLFALFLVGISAPAPRHFPSWEHTRRRARTHGRARMRIHPAQQRKSFPLKSHYLQFSPLFQRIPQRPAILLEKTCWGSFFRPRTPKACA